jgi:hypothetical protein
MEPLEVVRAVLGLALVLFLPGFALTLALWPTSKREVATRVVEELKKRGVRRVAVLGSEKDVEEILEVLGENLEVETVTEPGPGQGRSRSQGQGRSREPGKPLEAVVLAGDLEDAGIRVPEAELVVDLGNNVPEAIKVEDTIDGVERLALSFGLSVAIVPLLGIILDKTPYGIRTESVLAALLVVILIFTAVYIRRRLKMEMRPIPSF